MHTHDQNEVSKKSAAIELAVRAHRKNTKHRSGPVSHNGVILAYTRKSTDLAAQAASIHTQKANITQYCSMKGYTEPLFFADEGISGKYDDTPGWRELISFAKEHPGCKVIAYDMSRFARTQEVFQSRFRDIMRTGGTLELVINNTNDKILMSILAVIAEADWRNICIRLRNGRTNVAKKGIKLGPVPFGYIRTEEGDVAIDPSKKEIVRHMFRMRMNGASFGDIADFLNDPERLVPTPSGKGRWSSHNIPRILYSPIYMGVVVNAPTIFEWEV